MARLIAQTRCAALASLGVAVLTHVSSGSTATAAPSVAVVSPEPTATPVAIGPCTQGSIASLVDRPGVGRALTVNGSPCVVPAGGVVVEAGDRQQVTRAAAGTSTLGTVPQPLVRWGVGAGAELLVAPSLTYSRRSGADLGMAPFSPAAGLQDAGLGYKRQLQDRPWLQSALEAFVTLPTGFPTGANGFTAGIVTSLVGYSVVLPVGPVFSVTSTQNVQWSAATNPAGAQQGFFSYQPSLGVALAVGARGAILLQDQITTPAGLAGGSANRAFVGVQRTLSHNIVIDVEYEVNALPSPGFSQHAIGGGAAIRL